MILSDVEIKRYSRHIILSEIGMDGQLKLKAAKVLVIGAGGLGCPVLQYITAAGVGTIGICDFDFVEESNLQRQILFATSDIGRPKAIVAAEKLKNQNPYVSFIIHNKILTKENVLNIFENYDIIVDGSDNFPTRFLINDACVILKKPYVFGAIYKFDGQVAVFNYKGGPTYRCMIPEQPKSTEALSCSATGVIGVLPGIIGSYQACEVIKMITGIGTVLSGKLLLIDTLRMENNLISINRSENFIDITELGEYGEFCIEQFSNIKQISPLELFKQLENENIYAIDIREPEFYNYYHIKSAHIPMSILLENPDLVPDNQSVVIICEKGIKSRYAIEQLTREKRRENIFNLEGGIQAWINENLPIISNNP